MESASSTVLPQVRHPGKSGNDTTYPPSSASSYISIRYGSFIYSSTVFIFLLPERLNPCDKIFIIRLPFCNGQKHLNQFLFLYLQIIPILPQKYLQHHRSDSFVAIHKSMIYRKSVTHSSNFINIGRKQIFTVECRKRRRYGSIQCGRISHAVHPAGFFQNCVMQK